MDDVLLLEDDRKCIDFLMSRKPENLKVKVVVNSKEFRECLDNGSEAKLYFLDNKVPVEPTAFEDKHFIENCSYLFEKNPNAKVFYIGDSQGDGEYLFRRKYNIELVDKFDIWNVAKRELSK